MTITFDIYAQDPITVSHGMLVFLFLVTIYDLFLTSTLLSTIFVLIGYFPKTYISTFGEFELLRSIQP